VGRHRKPSRIRLPNSAAGVTAAAAVPALAGVVAAVALAQQAPGPAAGGDALTSRPHDATAFGLFSEISTEKLLAAAHVAAAQRAAAAHATAAQKPPSAAPVVYTVQPGDSLSTIAEHFYHNPDAWPALYWANQGKIHWADDIQAGQVLSIPGQPATIPNPPAQLAPAAQPAAYVPAHASTQPVIAQSAPPADTAAAPSAPAADDGTFTGSVPGGAFGACVVSRESGGQPQIMNSSGHYGLYQFSASTWAEYGGNPADFGNASVAEQNQVFANALAAGGEYNWAPYDGC
jgi:LysM repeat protein